jgi:hypothetical protein
MIEGRWTLTATFDPIGTGVEPSPIGEDAEFYGYMIQSWGEECEEDIEWTASERTVGITSDTLEHFAAPIHALMMRWIPKRIELVRNADRPI